MEGSVRKKGNNWYYQFDTAKIKGHRHKIERYGGKTKKEAELALHNALDKFYKGNSLTLDSNMSYSDYLDFWFKNYVESKLKINTQTNYQNVLNKYLKPSLGYYPLKSLTTRMLEEFSHSLLSDYDLANHSMEIIISVLKKSLQMSVFPYELLSSNPAQLVSYPKRQLSVEELARDKHDDLKIISFDQYEQLLKLIDENNDLYIPMQISFWTGLRRGEVCGLEWKNIDLNTKSLRVSQQMIQLSAHEIQISTPKTRNSYRTVQLSDSLVAILKKQQVLQKRNKLAMGIKYYDSDFVCTKLTGKPITPNIIKYRVTTIRNHVDFNFNFHSFRHTHATMLVESGANWKEIQKRMGHSKLSTTMDTYAHVSINRQKEVASRFENYINQVK